MLTIADEVDTQPPECWRSKTVTLELEDHKRCGAEFTFVCFKTTHSIHMEALEEDSAGHNIGKIYPGNHKAITFRLIHLTVDSFSTEVMDLPSNFIM